MKDAYVRYVLEDYVGDGNFDAVFGDGWIDDERLSELALVTCDFAFAEYGIDSRGKYVDQVWTMFEEMMGGGIAKVGDDYSDYWYKLNTTQKNRYIDDLKSKNPIRKRVSQLGEEALRRALNKIVIEDGLRSMEEKWDESNVDKRGDVGDPDSELAWLTDAQPDPLFFSSEEKKADFVSRATVQMEAVEQAELTNSQKAEARGYLRAARALAEIPTPPTDIIWTILTRAANIAGIASFFVALIALLAVI